MGEVNEGVLVQEFIDGTEYFVNTVSLNGKHRLVEVLRYAERLSSVGSMIYDYDGFISETDPAFKPLVEYTHKALDALGIQNGPSHAEIMIDQQGPVMMEIAARIDGVCGQNIQQECYGTSLYELTLDAYLDPKAFEKKFERQPQKNLQMVVHLISHQNQLVIPEDIEQKISSLPHISKFQIAH